MKFFEEQKDKILEVLYEIYDEWQLTLNSAIKNQNVNKALIEEYENELNRTLDFIEYFKANGELEISNIMLWTICRQAIKNFDKGDSE